MLMTIRELTLFIHLLFGIMWLGSIIFVGWGIYPIMRHFDYDTRQKILYRLMKHIHLILALLGLLTITSGVVLGTVLGPVHSFTFLFETRYGQLFLSAGVIASISLLWGTCVSFPFTMFVLKNKQYFNAAKHGVPQFLKSKMRHITLVSSVEVIGLLAVVYIMILL